MHRGTIKKVWHSGVSSVEKKMYILKYLLKENFSQCQIGIQTKRTGTVGLLTNSLKKSQLD